MFETREKREDGKGGSLLTLGRALQEERARAEDAAARHRAARSRREAETAQASKPASQESGPHQQTHARRDDRGAELWAAAQPQARTAAPRMPQPAPKPQYGVQPGPSDGGVYEASGSDDYWRPLIDPMAIYGRIASSKALIISTTLAGALLGVMIALATPKMYGATSEVMVDPRNLQLVERDITARDLPSEAALAIIDNQARILTSTPVLASVVQKLNLTGDAEFNGKGSSLSGMFNPIALLRSLLSRSDAPGADRTESKTIAALAKKVSVDRNGRTFILNVNAKSEDAEKSALIANTLVEAFVAASGRFQSETAGRASSELTGRLEELRKNVETAEDKVEQFKSANDIFDPQGRSIADQELITLNDQLTAARARTLELEARAKSARQLDVNSVVSGALPEGASSGVLTELRAQYASVKQSVDSAAIRLGPRHPQLQALEAQLDGARDQISGELRRIVSSVQVELRRAVELEQDLASRLAQLKVRRGNTSQDMVRLRELERDAASKRSVYEAFLVRARETGEQKDINTANISVVSPAGVPLDPSGPSHPAIAGLGTMLGLMAGIGIAGGLGALDSLRGSPGPGGRRRRRTSGADAQWRAKNDAHNAPPAWPSGPQAYFHDAKSQAAHRPQQEAAHPAYEQAAYAQSGYAKAGPTRHAPAADETAPNWSYPGQNQPPAAQSRPQDWQHAARFENENWPEQRHWKQPPQPEALWPAQYPPNQPANEHQWPPAYQPPHQPSPQDWNGAYQAAPAWQGQPQAQPLQHTPAPPSGAPDDGSRSVSASIDDIRATLRECRDAMNELAATQQTKRFF